jgi:hypothetical protein
MERIKCVVCGKMKDKYAKGKCERCYMRINKRAYRKTPQFKAWARMHAKKVWRGYLLAKKAGLIK